MEFNFINIALIVSWLVQSTMLTMVCIEIHKEDEGVYPHVGYIIMFFVFAPIFSAFELFNKIYDATR